ncbi:MAG: UvrD-helicase domain-containing protein, partial [Clostridia bacterium]|nr:UvrD-helicase domain-containing protein [Clostridia bacterium]
MDIMAQLNQSQQEAANFTEGYLRVIAGAGSGKTKLLVSRYANLVKNYGIDSANILCVTFTNKAAGEMRRRIRALVGEGYDTSLICTYHGFCARVLREDAGKIFFPENFQIIDTQQQKAILEDIYHKFELKLDYASFERKLKEIAFIKRNYDYVERMCSREKCRISDSVKTTDEEIVEEFLQRQKQNFALDFHDLINFVLYLFKKVDSVASKWQERLNYIQVDEFQDSSGKEMELV